MGRYNKAPSGSSKIGFLAVGDTWPRERGGEICQRFKGTVQTEEANFVN